MTVQQVVVCERESYLTAALERHFLGEDWIQFRWTPYPVDFFRLITDARYQLGLLNCPELSQTDLEQLASLAPGFPLLALAPEADFEFEALLRELGVQAILPENVESRDLVVALKKLLPPT